ncbi:MAG: glycosyltransferase family 2 protein [Roseiflexaceae bacterium]
MSETAPTVPSVLIIVLCYNGVELTLECLASLRRISYPRADVLVVDNASSDGTPARVRAAFPEVQVIENGANLGFAAGNNAGLRQALAQGYDYALLLNNDTEVAPDFLNQLVAVAEADPAVGVVGPTICYYAAPDTIWSAGGLIDWRQGLSSMRGLNERDSGQYVTPALVDFVTGCALLCKRAVLERAGLLDERFFMYYEETEWCVRAVRAGFGIVHVPTARVLHKIPLDARSDKPYVAYYMTRNRLLFLRQTAAPPATWLRALLFQDARTLLSLSLRPKWRERRPHRDAMLHAWRDFWAGRFGKQ